MNWLGIVLVIYLTVAFVVFCFACVGAAHSHSATGFETVLWLTFSWPYVLWIVVAYHIEGRCETKPTKVEDHQKLWEELEKMPGGDKNPFDTPIGPTKMCLSVRELVAFVDGGEETEGSQNVAIWNHLADCKECSGWLNRYKAVR